jgi:hypothetical protein
VSQVSNPSASVGSAQRPLNLSLIDGSWNVWAASDVFINEVRNPNGTFNGSQLSVPAGLYSGNTDGSTVPQLTSFLFDYAPNAAANIWAGDSITLVGANLPRLNGQNQDMPPVYPPNLSLNAGAGGITIENSIVLFPSSHGSLNLVTRDGGNLAGTVSATTLTGITMSDSGLPGWASFEQGHALTPLHLNDPNPVTLDIAGGIQSFGLTVPTFAEITVGGDTYNFGFLGRNLSASQTTSIKVAGDLTFRGDLTSVALTDALPSVLFNPALSGDSEVASKLTYNAATGTLTFIGQMTATELSFLLNPTRIVLDQNGNPVLDANGNPVTTPVTLDATQQAAIQQLYTASQSASLGDQGLALAGPGKFNIAANNIDLGISGGISVLAPDSALAALSPYGAALTITAAGNLDMTSTKIANESLLGAINLQVGGTLDVGGQLTTFGDPNAPKGIFTTSGGNISVTANGDVNVDGSRIAAYNGGNVNVLSQTGDVNAGTGGSGFVSMTALELEPVTQQLISLPASIPGSGILATTLPGSIAPVLGNITVSAPNGSISASLGGIIQIAFNGASTVHSVIDLTAAHDINAAGSGVIGSNLKVQAGGSVNGVFVGSGSVAINALQNVDVTAFSGGNMNISAAGAVSGTVISGGTVNVAGETISAAVAASSVSAAGENTGASLGVPPSNIARENARVDDDTTAAAVSTGDPDDPKKKKNPTIGLAQKTGRVTVLLPQTNPQTKP